MARQKAGLPIPLGLTTPMPVMTTRFMVVLKYRKSACRIVTERRPFRVSHRIQNRMSLGLYLSLPFCKTKCSYCNFASDVFSKRAYEGYVARLLDDIAGARRVPVALGCCLPRTVDSLYLGGGTPSLVDPERLRSILAGLMGG